MTYTEAVKIILDFLYEKLPTRTSSQEAREALAFAHANWESVCASIECQNEPAFGIDTPFPYRTIPFSYLSRAMQRYNDGRFSHPKGFSRQGLLVPDLFSPQDAELGFWPHRLHPDMQGFICWIKGVPGYSKFHAWWNELIDLLLTDVNYWIYFFNRTFFFDGLYVAHASVLIWTEDEPISAYMSTDKLGFYATSNLYINSLLYTRKKLPSLPHAFRLAHLIQEQPYFPDTPFWRYVQDKMLHGDRGVQADLACAQQIWDYLQLRPDLVFSDSWVLVETRLRLHAQDDQPIDIAFQLRELCAFLNRVIFSYRLLSLSEIEERGAQYAELLLILSALDAVGIPYTSHIPELPYNLFLIRYFPLVRFL